MSHGSNAAVINAMLQEAMALHRSGRLDEAKQRYDRILRRHPAQFDALHLLGGLHAQQGEVETAVGLLRRAVKIEPKAAALHLQLAKLLGHLGKPEAALTHYDRAVTLQPGSAEAFYFRGMTLQELRRPELAAESYDQAIALQPRSPAAYYNRGLALFEFAGPEAALASFEHAVALSPEMGDAHYNMGLMLTDLQRHEEAIASFDRVTALQPQRAEAYDLRGMTRAALRRHEAALADFDAALSLDPNLAGAHHNRGLALQALGRFPEAVASFDRAITLAPQYPEPYAKLGVALYMLKQLEPSLAFLDRALALNPNDAEMHNARGVTLYALGRPEEGLACHEAALASADRARALLPPGAPEPHNARGVALHALGRLEEELALYDTALVGHPNAIEAHNSRGVALQGLNRVDEAIASYNTALAIEPDRPDLQFNRSLAHLSVGQYEAGWCGYEARRRQPDWQAKRLDEDRLWTGQASLEGKTIYLYQEQGLGDTIQFSRYVHLLVEGGAKAILAVHNTLIPLMQQWEPRAEILSLNEPVPEFDLHCPLLSLPYAFATRLDNIPPPAPRTLADPVLRAQFEARLGPKTRPRVGLAWSGNPTNSNDYNRSLTFSQLEPLLHQGVEWISLQKQLRPKDAAPLAASGKVVFLGDELEHFGHTAALTELMDLVIAVDTSVAHLAGTMGKPTWVLLSFGGDWRWLTERSDSPWYPTARLFRQPRRGDWSSLLDEVSMTLRSAVQAEPH